MSEGNSNIANLLNQILTAIYGKDVRQSIHDAIQQCYSDVGDPALNEDAFKKAVQSKIDDGSIAAIIIGDDSIKENNISNGSVSPKKTDFLSYEIPEAIGSVTYSSNGYLKIITDLIDCTENTHIFLKINGPGLLDIVEYYSNDTTLNNTTTYTGYEWLYKKWTSADGIDHTLYKIPTNKMKLKIGIKSYNTSVATNSFECSFSEAYVLGSEEKFLWGKYGTPYMEDGSIAFAKTDILSYSTPNLIDVYKFGHADYNTADAAIYGNNADYWLDYIDVSSKKTLFFRILDTYANSDSTIRIACFDKNKQHLYTLNLTDGHTAPSINVNTIATLNDPYIIGKTEEKSKAISCVKVTIPDAVSYVRIVCPVWLNTKKTLYKQTIVSYSDITNLLADQEDYEEVVSSEFKNALRKAGVVLTDFSGAKTMVMIGDSLTNWAGGNDVDDGFLKIVHDATGIVTKNEGLAGAWWQTGEGQTNCGVQRVNAIIADHRKYDLYCFMLGTNAGSTTDTGETSSNTTTMSGAIRYCMEKLKEYDPTAQILVCLPPQRAEGNSTQETVNSVINKIVKSYSVPTIDMYHESGIVPNTTIANIGYLTDGLHLDKKGYIAVGNLLSSEIKYRMRL